MPKRTKECSVTTRGIYSDVEQVQGNDKNHKAIFDGD